MKKNSMPVYSLLNSIYLKIFYTCLWADREEAGKAYITATVRARCMESQTARLCSGQHLVVPLISYARLLPRPT